MLYPHRGQDYRPQDRLEPGEPCCRPYADLFLESMAAAAQAVHNYFNGHIIYINVMNNMSVDCDCDGHPAKPELQDMGIMASLDPVAVDQACLDKVFNYQGKPGDDNKPSSSASTASTAPISQTTPSKSASARRNTN